MLCTVVITVAAFVFFYRWARHRRQSRGIDGVMMVALVVFLTAQGTLWIGTYVLVAFQAETYLLGGDYLPFAAGGVLALITAGYLCFAKGNYGRKNAR